jgi:hypothetical protein
MKELTRLIEEDRGEGGSKKIISVGEIGLGEFCVYPSPMRDCSK